MKDTQTPVSEPARKAPPATHAHVILHAASRPGIVACGGYAVDRKHLVTVAEAARLVTHKGFNFATVGDKAACAEAMAALAAPITNQEG